VPGHIAEHCAYRREDGRHHRDAAGERIVLRLMLYLVLMRSMHVKVVFGHANSPVEASFEAKRAPYGRSREYDAKS
jgi:hypothetical protein